MSNQINLCYHPSSFQLACNCESQPVDCVVSEWSEWSECVDGTQSRTRTVIAPAANGGTACPVLLESRSCGENVLITYLLNLSGGISPGGFSVSVNGTNIYSTNQTDSGVINAPIGSLIQVYISAPVVDTSGGQSPSFYSNVYAQDASGVIATSGSITNSPSSMIEFTLTAETSVYASASVNSSGNGEVIQ
jgi:hypothetical protein